MPEIKKAYVTLMVADLDKAVDFYTKVLGLYEDLRFGDNWAEMVTQGITIGLHPKRPGPQPEIAAKMGWGALAQPHDGASTSSGPKVMSAPSQASSHHIDISIGFEVADIRKAAQELEAKGVKLHFQETEVNILAFFKDPDGNPLYLTQVR